jgi:hypothetical protein
MFVIVASSKNGSWCFFAHRHVIADLTVFVLVGKDWDIYHELLNQDAVLLKINQLKLRRSFGEGMSDLQRSEIILEQKNKEIASYVYVRFERLRFYYRSHMNAWSTCSC